MKLKFFFIFLGCGLIGFFLLHPMFSVSKIKFYGDSYVEKSELRKFVNPYLGHNIFMVIYINRLKYKLAHHFPMMQKIDISYGLPDEIYVDLESKKPIFSFLSEDHNYYLISKDASILGHRPTPETVVVKGVSDFYLSGKTISPFLMTDLLLIHREMGTKIPSVSYEIQLDLDHTWTLYLTVHYPIFLGETSHLGEKLNLLSLFLKKENDTPSKSIDYIDLSLGSQLLVKYEKQ